jgi:ferredoxin-type protein NapF
MPSNKAPRKPALHKSDVRWLVRVAILAIAVVILLPVFRETWLPVIVPALSPFVSIASVVATGTLPLAGWIGIGIGVVTVFRRRWFCRWVCPTGTCADVATRAGLRMGRHRPNMFAVGPWIAWITLGGAVFGYPLLLWLDPLALLSGIFGVLHGSSMVAGLWSAAGVATILCVSIILPGIWCSHVCPLGATQDGLAQVGGLLRKITERTEPALHPAPGLRRRTILGAMLGATMGVGCAVAVRNVRALAAGPLRPPGAVDETRFTGICVRCGNCFRACPANIIRRDQGESGIAGLLTPKLDFREDYCREDCTQCTQVCPSGALTALAREDKPRVSIGLPQVDMDVCKLIQGLDCYDCRNRCPYEAIKLEWSDIEYSQIPRIDAEKCNGCGACEAVCPTTPIKAIVVKPLAFVQTPHHDPKLSY